MFENKKQLKIINTEKFHENFWYIGSSSNGEILHIRTSFIVKNIGKEKATIVTAKMKGHKKYLESMIISHELDTNRNNGSNIFLPEKIYYMSINMIISDFKKTKYNNTRKIITLLTDELGNDYIIKNIKIACVGEIP